MSHHDDDSNHMKDVNAFIDSLSDNVTEIIKTAIDNGGGHHQHEHDHSSHLGHDHSTHDIAASHDHGGHMMKMWFHGGCQEVVLFDFWRINDWTGMLLSCILIFIMGAAYEGIKWFRVYLQMSQSSVQKCFKQDGTRLTELWQVLPLQSPQRRENSTEDVYQPTTTVTKGVRITSKQHNSQSPFALSRLVQAALYILQLVLAYWLMLIVMTYNNYLTAAVILGAGFGHWLFAVLKFRSPLGETADSFATDACH